MDTLIAAANWPAVAVGGVVSFLLGWLWYSPKLFGVKWAEGVGVELAGAGDMPVAAMAIQLIGTFLLALLVGATLHASPVLTVLVIATLVCFLVASGYYCKKSGYAIATEGGFILAMGAVMTVAHKLL